MNPAKRFAYDRFGPDVLQWRHCKTIRDFVFTGVQSTAVYYAASGSVLVLARTTDQEVTRLMGLELSPFAGKQSSMRELRSSLKEWLVQNTVRNDPEVKAAINRVLNRRRQDGGLVPG